ncbi:MAG TPA: hypothetical protein VLM37_06585 [Fibrobacteraceae bacterium]|nr:hypothetical protein [Fibrobacteraceae bacterium]
MNPQQINEPSLPPWEALQENLRSLVRAWKAAHESVLGFHWKKLPPFNLIFPQVDFLRIQRVMSSSREHCAQQAKIIQKLQEAALGEEMRDLRDYYQAMLPYVEDLKHLCEQLSQIAAAKQNRLAKGKTPLREFNNQMKQYEQSIRAAQVSGHTAQQAWNNLEPSRRAIHP